MYFKAKIITVTIYDNEIKSSNCRGYFLSDSYFLFLYVKPLGLWIFCAFHAVHYSYISFYFYFLTFTVWKNMLTKFFITEEKIYMGYHSLAAVKSKSSIVIFHFSHFLSLPRKLNLCFIIVQYPSLYPWNSHKYGLSYSSSTVDLRQLRS